jgi:type IV secretory pathway TrbF-like protein
MGGPACDQVDTMSVATQNPPEPAPLQDARRQFIEIYGSALVTVNYLRVALVLLALLAVGLFGLNVYTLRRQAFLKPLVIRIDEVGRAQAVAYDALTYAPRGQAPELKYFLVQFVNKHFRRMRASVRSEHAESLLFLDARLADASISGEQRSKEIDTFLGDASDEVEIRVRNVSFHQLTPPTFRAAVDFDKVFRSAGGASTKPPETFVAQIAFELRDQIPNALIPVNPLGLTITELRVDQAFR